MSSKRSNHTPGPWYAEMGEPRRPGFPPGFDVWHESGIGHVARVSPGLTPDPSGEANANLIADAPRLLAERDALRASLTHLARLVDSGDVEGAKEEARTIAAKWLDGDGAGGGE